MKGGTLQVLKSIIENKPIEPVIVNPESRFVVATYWWGRGNLNMNTARPCPDVRKQIIQDKGIDKYIPEELLEKNPGASDAEIKAAITAELKRVCQLAKREWKDPILFEDMIQKWEAKCNASNCNYVAVEYPEFAVKGGYQLAINAKPLFINQALKSCNGRGVLYIDGDMTINSYPSIFDLPNVDYMARAWDSDPRSSYMFKPLNMMNPEELARVVNRHRAKLVSELIDKVGETENVGIIASTLSNFAKGIIDNKLSGAEMDSKSLWQLTKHSWIPVMPIIFDSIEQIKKNHINGVVCYDPYVFQTSGGTMFFGNTPTAFSLLEKWEKLASIKPMSGKADDRVISMLIQQRHMLTLVNFVSLPIEYLWLTSNYETFMHDNHNFKRNDIIIEHPECLTSEEAAGEAGAASDRSPKFYGTIVEAAIDCNRNGGVLYEKSYFGNRESAKEFGPYLEYMRGNSKNLLKVFNMKEEFGEKTELVEKNHKEADAVALNSLARKNNLIVVSKVSELLAVLKSGSNAVYLPAGKSVGRTYIEKLESPLNFELIAVNNAEPEDELTEIAAEYRPLISYDEPIIFRSGNTVLIDLISLCRGIEDIGEVFNSGFMWLYRIRCAWVAPMNSSRGALANAKSVATAARLLNTLSMKANGHIGHITNGGGRQTKRR